MSHTDFVAAVFGKAKGGLVIGKAVGYNSFVGVVDHLGEVLKKPHSLAFQGSKTVVEGLPSAGNAAVVPEVFKGLLKRIGHVARPGVIPMRIDHFWASDCYLKDKH